jgi:hypothetical protein
MKKHEENENLQENCFPFRSNYPFYKERKEKESKLKK